MSKKRSPWTKALRDGLWNPFAMINERLQSLVTQLESVPAGLIDSSGYIGCHTLLHLWADLPNRLDVSLRIRLFHILINSGSRPYLNKTNAADETPLAMCISRCSPPSLIELVLSYPEVNVDTIDIDGHSPLYNIVDSQRDDSWIPVFQQLLSRSSETTINYVPQHYNYNSPILHRCAFESMANRDGRWLRCMLSYEYLPKINLWVQDFAGMNLISWIKRL
jgi:hypothetical protein